MYINAQLQELINEEKQKLLEQIASLKKENEEIKQKRNEEIQKPNEDLAIEMLKDGEPMDKIMRYSTLSKKEIEHLRSEMNQ